MTDDESKAKRKAYNAEYYRKNKDRMREQNRAWVDSNRERYDEYKAQYRNKHRKSLAKEQREYAARSANAAGLTAREWRRRRELAQRYNLTYELFTALLASQNGACAICGTAEPRGPGKTWSVDHDHSCCPGDKSCGKCIRGLLCHPCNVGLGMFGDVPEHLESAAQYLRANRRVDPTGLE